MENMKFFGKGIDPSRKEQMKEKVLSDIAKRQNTFNEKTKHLENKKTPEEIRMIEIVNQLLAGEFARLGITNLYREINPEKVYFFNEVDYLEAIGGSDSRGAYYVSRDSFMIKRNTDSIFATFKTMLHEAIHFQQAKEYMMHKDEEIFYNHRLGYSGTTFDEEGDRTLSLEGFNEAITETTVFDIVIRSIKELDESKLFEESDLAKSPGFSYVDFMRLLNVIVTKIAKESEKEFDVIMDEFKKSQFTGNMLPLRNIEKTFGENSLFILSTIGDGHTDSHQLEGEHFWAVYKYFTIEDLNERKQFMKEYFLNN